MYALVLLRGDALQRITTAKDDGVGFMICKIGSGLTVDSVWFGLFGLVWFWFWFWFGLVWFGLAWLGLASCRFVSFWFGSV